ncbi:putative deoxyribonuclease TATDN1 [Homalodisca vitripennis]|uniref:putative deoxyribonuclease TATDN1 n=1 Tax=Homalodisca vitripennis TaxID=197043 RepID=UPI001EE9D438|nr:putative deoxyribonuclease TATDN1 [Homalodisca vitripennis]
MFTKKGLIDIAANLTDPMYKGIYNGTKKHEPDLSNVLSRAWKQGLEKIIITGTSLEESKEAVEIAKTDDRLFCTVGCHPTRCDEFNKSGHDKYLQALSDLCEAHKDKVVAVGECGLDYDRIQFCARETQLKYFEHQLELAKSWKLPLFLHCRNAAEDVAKVLQRHQDSLHGGVIHSFDGTVDHAQMFISLGYYIGINGCSLKTAENLEVVKRLPANRLLLETDAPWCDIRPSHSGARYVTTTLPSVKKEKWSPDCLVKSRNEPANIIQVLEVVAAVRNENPETLSAIVLSNTLDLFFPNIKK